MNTINHKMITLARESRGLNQTEFAKKINTTQGNLSKIERDEATISEELFDRICSELNYKPSFFYKQNPVLPVDTYYRKNRIIDQKTKLQAEALINIYKFCVEDMLRSIEIPTSNIITLTNQKYESPQKVAQYLRSRWGVPKGAIKDMTELLESNGIIVIKVDFGTTKIAGRTVVTQTGQPIIFINSELSGDRERLTLAHELGHIVLHINNEPLFIGDEEPEAFLFGMEFLMPLNDCISDFDESLTLTKLSDLKRIWKVSMQSILYRVQNENIVSERRCSYLWIEISRRGWRKAEPINIPKEEPQLLSKLAKMHLSELEYSKTDLAELFGLEEDDLTNWILPKNQKLRIA